MTVRRPSDHPESVQAASAAEVIVRAALADVFDPWSVTCLRSDSPLSSLGMTPADFVCVSDAVLSRSPVVLRDGDLTMELTLANLVDRVEERWNVLEPVGDLS